MLDSAVVPDRLGSWMISIAFATYRQLPELTVEDQLIAERVRQAGVKVSPRVWDDRTVRWDQFDAVVVRSCWDYHHRPDQFAQWVAGLERANVAVWNPAALLRWNMHKRYLRDLERQGVPIVPTVWLPPAAPVNLAAILQQQGWDEAVVKPAVSASAVGTWRTRTGQAVSDQPRLAKLLEQGGVLVQQFQAAVCSEGEWSLIFFAREYSHAAIKRPGPGDFRVQESAGGVAQLAAPPQSVILQATRIMEKIASPWLYARVDGLLVDGTFRLMELELIEPFLFVADVPDGVERFAAAICRAIR